MHHIIKNNFRSKQYFICLTFLQSLLYQTNIDNIMYNNNPIILVVLVICLLMSSTGSETKTILFSIHLRRPFPCGILDYSSPIT